MRAPGIGYAGGMDGEPLSEDIDAVLARSDRVVIESRQLLVEIERQLREVRSSPFLGDGHPSD